VLLLKRAFNAIFPYSFLIYWVIKVIIDPQSSLDYTARLGPIEQKLGTFASVESLDFDGAIGNK